jgi:hypothetical protein
MNQFRVSATALNVRDEPSRQGSIIGSLNKDEVVDEIGLSADQQWMHVQKDGLIGWSFCKYLVSSDTPRKPSFVTYKIVADNGGKLWEAARRACDFWNKYLIPSSPIVMRLGLFTSNNNAIATSFKPAVNDGVYYGGVEFNTKYLASFTDEQIVGTIIHELGHTLGMGWDDWMNLFNHETGVFHPEYIAAVPGLSEMRAELHYAPGTVFSHWDEDSPHKKEIMTGFKDSGEYVMPVTIEVMKLLGHQVINHLSAKTSLADLLADIQNYQFLMIDEAESIDRDYFLQSGVAEEIYTEISTPLHVSLSN